MNLGYKSYFIILLSLILQGAHSQDIKKTLKEKTKVVKSIDPMYSDYSDLEPIKRAIGNARVVMLGEQDHGDTPTILAKIRLLKFLHEELDFEVLAFESDFYALNKDTSSNALQNIYSVWTLCKEYKPLDDYFKEKRSSNNPLILAGVDVRHVAPYTRLNYLSEIDSVFRYSNIPFSMSSEFSNFNNLLNQFLVYEYDVKEHVDLIDYNRLHVYINTIIDQIENSRMNEKEFWLQEFKSLKIQIQNCWEMDFEKTIFSNIRDRQMGENLVWLMKNKYPGKKIIVWAASFHNGRNIMEIKEYKEHAGFPLVTMGQVITDSLGEESVYNLAFTSAKGYSRWSDLPKPINKSVEKILFRKKYEYAFVDWKNYCEKKYSFRMSGTNHTPYLSNWTCNFDGVFYIRNMYSCLKPN